MTEAEIAAKIAAAAAELSSRSSDLALLWSTLIMAGSGVVLKLLTMLQNYIDRDKIATQAEKAVAQVGATVVAEAQKAAHSVIEASGLDNDRVISRIVTKAEERERSLEVRLEKNAEVNVEAIHTANNQNAKIIQLHQEITTLSKDAVLAAQAAAISQQQAASLHAQVLQLVQNLKVRRVEVDKQLDEKVDKRARAKR